MAGTASIVATLVDDPLWGARVFLQATGDPEAIRDEYARRADEWPPLHFAIVEPPADEAVDPLYRLGFAQMHAYGTGHPRVWTNWRVTNLVASRFRPSRGFRLMGLRLVRRVPDL